MHVSITGYYLKLSTTIHKTFCCTWLTTCTEVYNLTFAFIISRMPSVIPCVYRVQHSVCNFTGVSESSNTSSAITKIDIGTFPRCIPQFSAFIISTRSLMCRLNIVGARTSPCLIPHSIANHVVTCPLTLTAAHNWPCMFISNSFLISSVWFTVSKARK